MGELVGEQTPTRQLTDAEKFERIRQLIYSEVGFFAFTPTGTDLCVEIAEMMGWPLPWDAKWSVWNKDDEEGERLLEEWLAKPPTAGVSTDDQ